jgi:hypothetical protein
MMFQYVYVSSAVVPFNGSQLQDLLTVSRDRNQECGLTGMLLYLHGNFIQLLEGEKEAVVATRERIGKDPRHRGMITLLETECEKRDFPDWSMGFENIEGPEAAKLPGYTDFLQRSVDRSREHSGALKLLEFFREINVTQKSRTPL